MTDSVDWEQIIGSGVEMLESMVKVSDHATVAEIGENLLPSADAQLGPGHRHTMTIRAHLAAAYRARGNTTRATELWESLYAERARAHGAASRATVEACLNLADCHRQAGRTDIAVAVLEHALPPGDSVPEAGAVHLRGGLASMLFYAGRFDEAIAQFERVVADGAAALPADDRDLLAFRSNLAHAYLVTGRVTAAIGEFEHVATEFGRIPDADRSDALGAHLNLASAYHHARRFTESAALFRDALGHTENDPELGPDHDLTLSLRGNLATALWADNRVAEAIPYLEQNAAVQERLRPDHPDTLATRHSLATAYRTEHRFDEAIDLYEAVLADRQRLLPADHPDIYDTLFDLAAAHREAGNTDKAVGLFRHTLTTRTRVLGVEHPETLLTRARLADARAETGHVRDALTTLDQTLAALQRVAGPDHVYIPQILGLIDHWRNASRHTRTGSGG
ncbi:tetratricopeptide repeat protein [Nocardia blacklockiae]|uniref:tetratricopeptide repeat protein n=1 Tax=Nocardia blacklockiae TaxID=480036 RepID=UPI0018942684|nr:tetratricopeptide repeat protein [Nocardia blacklockiae]MBF6169895.1 tetratricopeptide repeat protein [Nocardia blacklockiae]